MSGKNNKKAKSNEFTVYIYESEYRQIQAWVDKHQNLETGGDLFGLWSDDHTAVVQLVLGPGKHCRRTSASFYQDIEYLERVGNLLTNQEGLCHIGEWHSHHRLGLKEPSGGDKNTVWRNMERYGIHRFCLFIATIDKGWSHMDSTPDDVGLSGFIFETGVDNYRLLSPCKFIRPLEESPFRLKCHDFINEGVESVNEERAIQKKSDVVPVKQYSDEIEKHSYQPVQVGAESRKKLNPQQSWLRRFINLILYLGCSVWNCCKRACSALGLGICKEEESNAITAAEPTKYCWKIFFRDLIHYCCPICWFIPKPY